MKSKYRYSYIGWLLRAFYRIFFPVPASPWTDGYVEDIGAIKLTPPERLIGFFEDGIKRLRVLKGKDIGDYLEFGVFNGNSIGTMYQALRLTDPLNVRLFGFDSFEGLPAESEDEDNGVWKEGYYSCSFDQMKICLQKRGIPADEMIWIKGWYNETLTEEFAQKHNLKNIGFIFIDCDAYSSAKTVLDFVAPYITSQCIICLDDWKLNNLDLIGEGEYRAFNEFLEKNTHIRATKIDSYSRKSKSFLLTLK